MELYYQIALKSVPFDNSYKNVLRFDTRSEQEAYFETNTLFSNSPNVNFNVGSLYATNVIYDGTEENINELLNHNYCIIKDNRPNAQLKYYYYFVTNAMQDCDNRIKLSLELDIFQTYYIDLNFGDSIIYKSHLNRFIDNGDGTVSFDGTPTSKLFEREDIKNVAKRMTKRSVLKLYPNTELGNWFKEHVLAWIYLYVDPTHKFIGNSKSYANLEATIPQILNESKKGGGLLSNISVIAFPIVNAELKLSIYHNDTAFARLWGIPDIPTTYSSLQSFLNKNNQYAYIYAIKISDYPPITNYNINYSISEIDNSLTIMTENLGEGITNPLFERTGFAGSYGNSFLTDLGEDYGVVTFITKQYNGIETEYYTEKKFTFNKNEIISSNKNVKFNPKLLGSDYYNLRISDQTENGFDYDLQKLNKNDLKIKYTEALVPDMCKKYIRITNNSGIYIPETDENLTGFIANNDNSIIMPTSAFQNMLANNKNYFLQNSINRQFGLTQGLVSSGLAIAGGIGNPLQITAGVIGGLNSVAETTKSKINENLTVDNMKNAPADIVGAKGNAIFEYMYSDTGIVVEEWDIFENEKEMINDYMCLYGFTYNRVDNVKNVDNIRKFYNFVRADIETINGANISETVHQKFRQCFANGVRFWNTDTFSYEKENYERWLENE